MINPKLTHPPPLDPSFLPAYIWNRAYHALVQRCVKARSIKIALIRNSENVSIFQTMMLPSDPDFTALNWRYLERLIKFLLWQRGASTLRIDGVPELVPRLQKAYRSGGERSFDAAILGDQVFGQTLHFTAQETSSQAFPQACEPKLALGNHFDGYRIGFDLGGSDRKCAALANGEVIFSEEIAWDPYFQTDPAYHQKGIRDSILRAASKLPRVDAIGGSAAGIYMDNQVRVASLFRGIPKQVFDRHIRPIFQQIALEFENRPFIITNDGDVTALAGSRWLGDGALLGLSMGTSQAAGYVGPSRTITPWLNELAFAPVDYRPNAPLDEWSQDAGCGVQYFSQQAVARLLERTGILVSNKEPLAKKLLIVQERMAAGDERVAGIYQSIGTYLAYSLAHYADFYEIRNVLLLGRVLSGEGGQLLITTCQSVLEATASELSAKIKIATRDETLKRHGQAIAAAGLAELK